MNTSQFQIVTVCSDVSNSSHTLTRFLSIPLPLPVTHYQTFCVYVRDFRKYSSVYSPLASLCIHPYFISISRTPAKPWFLLWALPFVKRSEHCTVDTLLIFALRLGRGGEFEHFLNIWCKLNVMRWNDVVERSFHPSWWRFYSLASLSGMFSDACGD